MIESLIMYAYLMVGTPYVWGGDNAVQGYDCSGYVLECLNSIGFNIPDMTANDLYRYLKDKEDWRSGLTRGSILFFGKSTDRITHVAIAVDIDNKLMLEAGGGGSRTRTIADAARHDAFVRRRPIRKDLIAALMPGSDYVY